MIQLPEEVLSADLSLPEIGFFAVLAYHVQTAAETPLTREELVRRAHISKRTVDKYLARYRALGLLAVRRAPGRRGGTIYRLLEGEAGGGGGG